jgi:AraC-like DNA-binding protein
MARSRTVEFDSSRSDFTPYGFTCELWSPTPMPRPDRHNEVEINFLQSGSLTYLLGGRRTTVEAGRLVLFWGAIPHQILKWETTRPYFVATLPLASFLSWGFPDHFARPILAGAIVTDPVSTPGDSARFQQWVSDFHSPQPLFERVAQMEIQARLLRLSATLSPKKASSRKAAKSGAPNPALGRADQIACHIAQHYAEPLTAAEIAKNVGLHPNYAMGLFRKAFGTTMVDFLVQHRLSHAQRLLVTTDDPVIQIAAAAGFQSLSRFNEAFKRSCGCAPRDYRKAHRGQI